jgi:hypothetical protein
MAVQKDQAARLTYISEFIEEIKAFGLVERPAHAESRRCDWEKQLNETHRHMTGIRESAWVKSAANRTSVAREKPD